MGDISTSSEPGRVGRAARDAEVDQVAEHLPKGLDTLLGRWFDEGTELSMGEWQRVALARAIFRDAAVLILDEPTSAMDPWTEAAWLARFRELTRDRITILITHRLTTAMCADVIHVMQDGRVIESGSHASLFALGGRYSELWKGQAPARAAS